MNWKDSLMWRSAWKSRGKSLPLLQHPSLALLCGNNLWERIPHKFAGESESGASHGGLLDFADSNAGINRSKSGGLFCWQRSVQTVADAPFSSKHLLTAKRNVLGSLFLLLTVQRNVWLFAKPKFCKEHSICWC